MPITEEAQQTLELRNTSGQRLAYKIKTTLPKLYCVRPNASIVEKGQSVTVSILRQPKEQPVQGDRVKDKFLVLSHPVDDSVDAITDLTQLWAEFEKDKPHLDQQKIKVQYMFGAAAAAANPVPAGDLSNSSNTASTDASHLANTTEASSAPSSFDAQANIASLHAKTDAAASKATTASTSPKAARTGSAEPGFPNSGNTMPVANQSLMGIPVSAVAALFLAVLLGVWWKFF